MGQTNQTVTNGTATSAINFPSSGCSYNWTNSNPAIGLPASGSGSIPSFTAVNNGSSVVTATITATPATLNGFAYVSNYFDNDVSVIDVTDNKVIATIPVGNGPTAVCESTDGAWVYVANNGDGTVSVISTASQSVVNTLKAGNFASDVVLSADNSLLYVANADEYQPQVFVIDVKTGLTVATIEPYPHATSWAIIESQDGTRLYITDPSNGLFVINTATNSVIDDITVGLSGPSGELLSPDGSLLYVTNMKSNTLAVVNTTTDKVVATIPVGVEPLGLSISPDGKTIYVANENDYLGSTGGIVSVVNTITNTVVATIPFDGGYVYNCSLSPDGSALYVPTPGSNAVAVVNTSDNKIITNIPIGFESISIGDFVFGGCKTLVSTITVTPNPSTPAITTSTLSGNIVACAGSASSSPNIEQFTVSGAGLSDDLSAVAPAGFEISLNSSSDFGSNLTIPQSNGNVSSTIVYVRSSASATGSITGNIIFSSTGAADQSVAVNGIVNPIPTVNQVSSQTVSNGTTINTINFTGSGGVFNWVNDTPGIGLPASGTGDIAAFTAINKTNTPIVATITVTPANNTLTVTCPSNPVTFTITVMPFPSPAVSINGNLTGLATTYGTSSSSEAFTISGTAITNSITITSPTGFELSADNITFSNLINITTPWTILPAPLYIRLASTTPVGNYSGNILSTSAGVGNATLNIPNSMVTPASLIVTADNKTKVSGTANPLLTITISGFVNDDGITQLISQPLLYTPATVSSPAGVYPITVSGAISPNYTFQYIPGTLTIIAGSQSLIIPNAFTPNGDGVNDVWNIPNLTTYPLCTVSIFTRYGLQVYHSNGYSKSWDGICNGAQLPVGTYYYVINLGTGAANLSGPITIIR